MLYYGKEVGRVPLMNLIGILLAPTALLVDLMTSHSACNVRYKEIPKFSCLCLICVLWSLICNYIEEL